MQTGLEFTNFKAHQFEIFLGKSVLIIYKTDKDVYRLILIKFPEA